MKKKLMIASALSVVIAVFAAAAAFAAGTFPSVTIKPTVTPNKAGTVKKPQPVKLGVKVNWQTLGAADQPIVTALQVLFPKGAYYNGAKYPSCSLAKVSQGPQACPQASITGSGTGVAYADTTLTRPKITVVNGGGNTIYFYTVLNNPARVQEPVVGHLQKMSGKWAYKLSVTIPQNLRIVAGVPIELTSLAVTAGKGNWLETTGCAGHKWPFQATAQYLNPNTNATGSETYVSSLACKPS